MAGTDAILACSHVGKAVEGALPKPLEDNAELVFRYGADTRVKLITR